MVLNSSCSKSSAYKTTVRIDIHCEIQAVPFAQLSQMQAGEPSAVIRERVIRARNIQTERFSSLPKHGGQGRVHCNAQMTETMLHQFAEPDAASLDMLRMAMGRLKLSARAYTRILKVARTIADLDNSEKVQSQHIAEAIIVATFTRLYCLWRLRRHCNNRQQQAQAQYDFP